MRVQMLTSVAGTRDDGTPYCYEMGAEYELPADEARDLVARPEGMPRARPVAQPPSGHKQAHQRETR